MPKKPKFFKTTFTVTVLSEGPFGDWENLHDVAYAIDEGDCSGHIAEKTEVMTPKEAAKALQEQGSDPEFFQLDAEGNDISDEG